MCFNVKCETGSQLFLATSLSQHLLPFLHGFEILSLSHSKILFAFLNIQFHAHINFYSPMSFIRMIKHNYQKGGQWDIA